MSKNPFKTSAERYADNQYAKNRNPKLWEIARDAFDAGMWYAFRFTPKDKAEQFWLKVLYCGAVCLAVIVAPFSYVWQKITGNK